MTLLRMDAERLTQVWFVVDSNTREQVVNRLFRSYAAAERAMERYSRAHATDEVAVGHDVV